MCELENPQCRQPKEKKSFITKVLDCQYRNTNSKKPNRNRFVNSPNSLPSLWNLKLLHGLLLSSSGSANSQSLRVAEREEPVGTVNEKISKNRTQQVFC